MVRVLFPTWNISTKKPYNIFLVSQNPKSCGTSKLPENFEKLQQFWSEFCSPPGIFLQKRSHNVFFLSQNEKALGLHSRTGNISTKKPHFIFRSCQTAKSYRTSKLKENVENQFLESYKSSGHSSVPPKNISTKEAHKIFLLSQNPKSCVNSKLPKNFENQILKSYNSSGQSSVPHLEHFYKKAL